MAVIEVRTVLAPEVTSVGALPFLCITKLK